MTSYCSLMKYHYLRNVMLKSHHFRMIYLVQENYLHSVSLPALSAKEMKNRIDS